MQTPQQMVLHQQLSNIIFEGTFPTKVVTITNVPFVFILTDQIIPRKGVNSQVDLFSSVISCAEVSGREFIKDLPSVLFYLIARSYADFQVDTIPQLIKELYEFTKTTQSRDYWLLYKGSKSQYTLPVVNNRLNIFQKYWIIFNQALDRKENIDLITDVFEALQPWLDRELYAKIKEEENTRQNAFFDDDTIDKELQEKARKIVKEKNNPIEDDLDIVTLDK